MRNEIYNFITNKYILLCFSVLKEISIVTYNYTVKEFVIAFATVFYCLINNIMVNV